MTHQSFGSDRLKAIRPFTGAEKLAPRPRLSIGCREGGDVMATKKKAAKKAKKATKKKK